MHPDKVESCSSVNIDISNNMMDHSISEGFSHSQQKSCQPTIHLPSHQALIYESKYLIAEAKKLMSNCQVTYSPQRLIDDSKCLIAHAEKTK